VVIILSYYNYYLSKLLCSSAVVWRDVYEQVSRVCCCHSLVWSLVWSFWSRNKDRSTWRQRSYRSAIKCRSCSRETRTGTQNGV